MTSGTDAQTMAGRFSASAKAMRFSAIRRTAALIDKPGIISFAPGQPSPETFPVEDFRRIADRVISELGPAAFQYIQTRGQRELVEAVREYARAKAMPVAASETLISEGSQQGLDLVARVLLDPGDVVVVELPSYIGATAAFRAARAQMVGVRLDEHGVDLDHLRSVVSAARSGGQQVKLVYVIPNYQNPSGISHTAERREGLLQLATELDLLVVEDDPYGDLYFDQPPPDTLKALDDGTRVIYLSSFSKILAPGLRSAFVLGPAELLAKIEIAKQAANLCGSALDQRIILDCLREGLIERQKGQIRPYYRRKRDVMLETLQTAMPAGVSWTRPGGGLFVWLSLPSGLDAEALLETAVAEGVAYVPGAPFCVDGSGANTMRLTFGREEPDALREGVQRLARVVSAGQG